METQQVETAAKANGAIAHPPDEKFTAVTVDPKSLTFIVDEAHPLFALTGGRAKLPVNEGLVGSVRLVGILHPPIIRKNGKITEILIGAQRVKAAIAANLATIPARMVKDGDDFAALKIVAENEARVEASPLTRAAQVKAMLDPKEPKEGEIKGLGLSVAQVAQAFAKPESWVKAAYLLNALTGKAKKALESGALTVTAGAKLAKLDAEKQIEALDAAIEASKANVHKGVGKLTTQNVIKAAEGKTEGPQAPKRSEIESLLKFLTSKESKSAVPDMSGGGPETYLRWVLYGEMRGVIREAILAKAKWEETAVKEAEKEKEAEKAAKEKEKEAEKAKVAAEKAKAKADAEAKKAAEAAEKASEKAKAAAEKAKAADFNVE